MRDNELVITNNSTEVVTQGQFSMDDNKNFIADLTTRTQQYCSMVATTDEERVSLFNAQNNPEKRISDCINEVIPVKHVFVETVTCVNKETGEMQVCPRIVLIDEKGIGYQAVSIGLFSALKKILATFGEPKTWTTPKQFKVRQITKGDRKLLTLDAVMTASKK